MDIDKKQPLTALERVDAVNALCAVNDLNFNTLKVLEEMAETGELLLKMLTKADKYKPSIESIIEEVGDLELRLYVLKSHLMISSDVRDRFNNKLVVLYDAVKAGKIGSKVTITKTN